MKKIVSSSFFCFVILLFGGFGATVRGQESAKTSDTSLIPILGNYANKSVPLGGSSTVTPDTGASNIGTATVSVSGNFKGSVTVSPSSGAVRVLNAYPVGNYTVTVRGSDFAGFTVTRSFTLTVTNVSSCNTLDFAGIRTIVGNSPGSGLVVAEVNGDGRQDLITSNSTNSGIQANFSVMPRVCTVDLNLLGALPSGTAGQIYSKTIYANGGIAPYNFTVSGLPAGLNFTTTADSLTIFGTPSIGGQFNVSIGISDNNPFSEINIAPQAANSLTQVLPLQIAFAPTAANVSISGKVLTTNGTGVHGAIITLTDQNGNYRTVRSSSFGNFRFEGVEAGQIYVINVNSKHWQFTPQVLTINEDVTELNLTANE